jgi:hypothetical protein
MSDESIKKDFGPEDLINMADRDGVAIANVKDGYVLIFTRKQLELLLSKMGEQGKDKGMIFVKHREFKN